MPLQIVRNDITKMKVDAIVNAANSSLMGGGGVDGCIHRAAGPELLVECEKLNGCKTGSAKITKGYKLPCKYVIHAVGPRWYGGQYGEHDKLVSCYQTSLALAKEHGCESVAFPLISSGIFGYPKDEALKVAIDTISSFLLENDMMVYIVIFDRKAYQISSKLFADINAYIDDRYVEEHRDSYAERISRLRSLAAEESCPIPAAPMVAKAASLDDALKQIDESFSEMLLRKIDECGMTDAECYKKANIDRKLFSKIRSDKLYRPSKPTVIAFALALELPLDELKDMPYIMRLGKLQPVSIPEFSIWSMLLWDVLTHDELRKKYFEKMEEVKLDPSGFEKALEMLVKRKLIIKGVGYTGADALYNMLYDTYVIPLRGVQGTRRLLNIAKLLKQGKVNFFEAVYLLQPDKGTEAEQRIMKLVTQTPLSVPELVRCFENDVRDVSSADKVISAIYTEESDNQARLNNACSLSNHRQDVLEATTNLYLTRQVILEHA